MDSLWLTLAAHLPLFKTYINQLVKILKEYPYPNDFFNTAVGFSSSALLQAKGKKH